ncbi:MAG: hypothetical protein WBO70_03205 [Erysipelotrichaceae bacterium]
MQAIIISNGLSSRMWPYNLDNKCVLSIGFKSIIKRLVLQLNYHKVEKIHLILDQSVDLVKSQLKEFDNINYVIAQENQLKKVLLSLKDEDDDFIVLFGDLSISDYDFSKLIHLFQSKGDCLLVKKSCDEYQVCDHMAVVVDNDKVKKVYGHPRNHYAALISLGMFGLSKYAFGKIDEVNYGFEEIVAGGMPDNGFYLETLINNLVKEQDVYYHVCEHKSFNIDTPIDLLRANHSYCMTTVNEIKNNHYGNNLIISDSAIIKGNMICGDNVIVGDNVVIKGNVVIGNNVTIENGVIMGHNCMINEGSTIRNYAIISDNTIIGKDCKIENNADICGMIFDKASIVHHSEIYGIIGRAVDVGAGVLCGSLRFDDQNNSIKIQDKRYKGSFTNATFVGDYSRIGVGVIFNPGQRVGNYSCVGGGVVVSSDIESNKIVSVKQDLIFNDWGSKKYNW